MARRVHDLGRRFNDPNLVAAGLYGEGRALVNLGQLVEGLALIDEAMVEVPKGRITPLFTGSIYCLTLEACHEVAEIRRLARGPSSQSMAGLPISGGRVGCDVPGSTDLSCSCSVAPGTTPSRGAREVIDLLEVNRVDDAAEAWYVVGKCVDCAASRPPRTPMRKHMPEAAPRNLDGHSCGSIMEMPPELQHRYGRLWPRRAPTGCGEHLFVLRRWKLL